MPGQMVCVPHLTWEEQLVLWRSTPRILVRYWTLVNDFNGTSVSICFYRVGGQRFPPQQFRRRNAPNFPVRQVTTVQQRNNDRVRTSADVGH
jgi:hypothetical protein